MKRLNRRGFVKKSGLYTAVGLGVMSIPGIISCGGGGQKQGEEEAEKPVEPVTPQPPEFELADLPYHYGALEPIIDVETMKIHHGAHHQGYVNNLNKAVQEANITEEKLEDILAKVSEHPTAVRNNGGGHYNHTHFWESMRENQTDEIEPTGNLREAIMGTFDSFENFKEAFTKEALGRFGSGWAWLVVQNDGKLAVGSTSNQDNPLMDVSDFKGKPILGLDVWEHAYYLNYQNERGRYVKEWWNLVDWNKIEERFNQNA